MSKGEQEKLECGATWSCEPGESEDEAKRHACALEIGHAGNHRCRYSRENRICCDWPRVK